MLDAKENARQSKQLKDGIMSILKKLFGKGQERQLQVDFKGMPDDLENNSLAKFMANTQKDVLTMVGDFSNENSAELSKSISSNKIHDVSSLVDNKLLPQINSYFENLEMPIDVESDPNRRIPEYTNKLADNVTSRFSIKGALKSVADAYTLSEKSINDELDRVNQVSSHDPKLLINPDIPSENLQLATNLKMEKLYHKPSISHTEMNGQSPRTEMKPEITDALTKEMNAPSPSEQAPVGGGN